MRLSMKIRTIQFLSILGAAAFAGCAYGAHQTPSKKIQRVNCQQVRQSAQAEAGLEQAANTVAPVAGMPTAAQKQAYGDAATVRFLARRQAKIATIEAPGEAADTAPNFQPVQLGSDILAAEAQRHKAEIELIARLQKEFAAKVAEFRALNCRRCARIEVEKMFDTAEQGQQSHVQALRSKYGNGLTGHVLTQALYNENLTAEGYSPYLRHIIRLFGCTWPNNAHTVKELGLCQMHAQKKLRQATQPITQVPQLESAQVPAQPKHLDEVMSKEWEALRTTLDFDYEVTRETFDNGKCRDCAHAYINGLYQDDPVKLLLTWMQTATGNPTMTVEDLKNQITQSSTQQSDPHMHPYYTYLATITAMASGIKTTCKRHKPQSAVQPMGQNPQNAAAQQSDALIQQAGAAVAHA